ncbi:AAA family ATPase [Dactylosporangium sp. McL0621]|uniref:AAA family ATPase n=1 Tax=Dactylosporangium sp. McL0621 TaxID=3415678 RepID=UPI003CF01796
MNRVTLRGRAEEMERLLGALRHTTRTGCGSLVAVVGEPGMGKTTLLRDAAEQTRRKGFAIGVGKAEEIDQVAPGAPLLLALRSGARPLVDADAFAGLEPLYERPLWLVDRVAELLEGLAARQPVLIGLDDVQWADPLTRFALRYLPSRLAGAPVVWLLTSRLAPIDRLEDVVGACDPAVAVTRVPLGPMRAADLDALAADRLGAVPDARTLQLLRGVGGSPFWAVQLLTGLARRRARGLPENDLHAELIASIRQRLAMVPPPVAAVVRVVAVLGRVASAEMVADLVGDTTPELVFAAALQGQDEGLMVLAGDGLSLPHDLIREAVYAHIPPVERRRLHRACGRRLERDGAGPLAAAPHFRASAGPGDFEAADVVLRAAAQSAHVMPEQAAELAREAVARLGRDHPRRLETGERALAVLIDAQRESDVIGLADAMLPFAGTPAAVARIEVAVGRALWANGACRELERRAGAALERAAVPEVERARLLALRALAATRTPSAPAAAPAAAAADAEGRRLGDDLTRQIALLALTEAGRNFGDHAQVLAYFDELHAIAPAAHRPERIRALQHLDRYAEAAGLLAAAREDADGDLDRLLPSYLYAQMWQHHNLAELDAADATARTLLRQAEALRHFTYAMNARMILCGVAIYRGELGRARELLAPLESAAESADELRASRLRLMLAWLAAEAGDPAEALRIVGPLLDAADNGCHAWAWSPPWMRVFGDAARRAGDAERAARALHIAELGARRNPGVATLEGVALHLRGHLGGDVADVRATVAVLRRSPRPIPLAAALHDLGSALAAGGDTPGGLAALREAHAIYARVGASAYAGAVAGELAALGGPARRRPPAGPPRALTGRSALTETEARVAGLIVAGHTNRSAAAELGVSANTIGTHLRAIFAKLGVNSRVQLTNALRTGDQR